jgi:hypothetical protein
VLGNATDTTASNQYYAGALDEMAIWDRSLSEAEILGLAGRDVAGPPAIVTQPQSAAKYVGGTASFMVEVTGLRPVTYQWYHNGTPITGAVSNHIILTNLALADNGAYTVVAQNSLGAVTSAPPTTLTIQEITNITVGLVAYWPFEDAAGTSISDASGRGHHGALQNAPMVSRSAGVIGNAQDFDGVDDFVIVPNAPDLNFADQLTISLWINPRTLAVQGGLGRLVRKDINLDLTLVSSSSSFLMYGLNKMAAAAPNRTVTLNEWQHLAVVLNNGAVQFFKNGQSLGNPVPFKLGGDNTNDLIIGNFGADLAINRVFNGFMDDLGIWARPLSPAEIDGIYQNGLLGQSLTTSFQPLAVRSLTLATSK